MAPILACIWYLLLKSRIMSSVVSPVLRFLFKTPLSSTQAIAVGERYHFSVHRSVSAAVTTWMSFEPLAVSRRSSTFLPDE